MSWKESAKKAAAIEATKLVKSGQVVGLGTGSTVRYAIIELGRRIREEGLDIVGIPTSYQSMMLAAEVGIPLTNLFETPSIDIAIDGADQVDFELNLIKGGGAAHAREKVVDSLAKQFVVVVDETKVVEKLGKKQPVPVEVLPFALPAVVRKLEELGGKPSLRMASEKDGPVVTDNGNFVVDVDFGVIENPAELDQKVRSIPGVVETGLFIGLADVVFVGCKTEDVKILRRRR